VLLHRLEPIAKSAFRMFVAAMIWAPIKKRIIKGMMTNALSTLPSSRFR